MNGIVFAFGPIWASCASPEDDQPPWFSNPEYRQIDQFAYEWLALCLVSCEYHCGDIEFVSEMLGMVNGKDLS